MNLKNFKLISEDDNSYKIAHPNGKELSVQKSKLHEKAHAAIKALKMEKGGGVPANPDILEGSVNQGNIASNDLASLGSVMGQGQMGIESPVGAEILPPTPEQPYTIGEGGKITYGEPEATVQTPLLSSGEQPSQISPEKSIQPAEPAAPAVSQNTAANPISQNKTEQNKILENQQKNVEDYMKATEKAGQASAAAYAQYNKQMAATPTPQDIVNSYKQKDDQLYNDFANKKIDPNRYMNNLSTGSKILAGIGLVFSGIGSAVAGGPNLAMQNINNAINQDIESQASDQSRSMSLWKMNREKMGSDIEANLATRNQMWTGVQAKVAEAAANAANPAAKLRAQEMLTNIEQQKAMNRYKMALLTPGTAAGPGGQGLLNVDPSVLVNDMIQDPQQKTQAFKEIKAAQDTRRMSESILGSFEQAAKENTVARTGAGWIRTPASVYALHQAMQPTFGDLEGTVRQAAMDNTFKNITPSPGDTDHTLALKRDSLQQYLKSKASAPVAKGSGIDLSRFSSTAPLDSMEVKKMNGVDYIKVPGGWAKK